MPKETLVIDVHMKALDILEEIKGIDALATEEDHIPATTATILYYMLTDKEEENESI